MAMTGAATAQQRQGDWIQTFTGRQFWPMDPRADEVDITDIAHALSQLCRFGGHCRKFYSVAEHSVRVAQIVCPEYRKWALLHDASEAYLVDLPRPIKRFSALGDLYRVAEDRVMRVIAEQFDLQGEMPSTVKYADGVLLVTEQRDLMALPPTAWKATGTNPLEGRIEPLMPETAKYVFLNMFRQLFGDRQECAQ